MATRRNLVQSARHLHAVRTPEAWEAKHVAFLKKRHAHGMIESPHPWESARPIEALVAMGRWVVVCPCGNAAAVDWDIARCFDCGAVHQNIVRPDAETRADLEYILSARPHVKHMNWTAEESLLDLATQNAAKGDRW